MQPPIGDAVLMIIVLDQGNLLFASPACVNEAPASPQRQDMAIAILHRLLASVPSRNRAISEYMVSLKEDRNERCVCPGRERGGRTRGEPASAGDFRASQPCDPIRPPCAGAGPRRKPASAQSGPRDRGRQRAPSRSGTGRAGCALFRGAPRERDSAA